MTINRRKFLKFFGLGAVATVVPAKLVAATEPSKRLLILKPRSPGWSTYRAGRVSKSGVLILTAEQDEYLTVVNPKAWAALKQDKRWIPVDQ